MKVPFRSIVVALNEIVPGVAGTPVQLRTVIVPAPALAALVPQALFAFTVIPEAAYESAVVPVMVILRVVDVPVKPLGNVQV